MKIPIRDQAGYERWIQDTINRSWEVVRQSRAIIEAADKHLVSLHMAQSIAARDAGKD